jgi:predicted GNAT family acetyltransferase
MTNDPGEIPVTVNTSTCRFEATLEGDTAFIDFELHRDTIIFTHAEVPARLGGRGIASAIARSALEYAKHEQLKVIPLCPFVATYIRKHKEYQTLVPKAFLKTLTAP